MLRNAGRYADRGIPAYNKNRCIIHESICYKNEKKFAHYVFFPQYSPLSL